MPHKPLQFNLLELRVLAVTADKLSLEVSFDPQGKLIEEERQESG